MRNTMLSVMIVAAVSAGACSAGNDESASEAPAGSEANTAAIEQSDPLPTSGPDTQQVTEPLPATASPLPLAAALGVVFVGAAALVRRYRR